VRLFDLMHDARALLLDLGGLGSTDLAGVPDRVKQVAATLTGGCELPVIGVVPAPGALLIRPDGHAAWVGEGDVAGLPAALARWFGAAMQPAAAEPGT
jgi:hypothetical protein